MRNKQAACKLLRARAAEMRGLARIFARGGGGADAEGARTRGISRRAARRVARATMAAPTLKNVTPIITTMADFNAFVLTDAPALHVLFFWAAWDEPSKPGGALDSLITKLAELHPAVRFGKVSGGEHAPLARKGRRRTAASAVQGDGTAAARGQHATRPLERAHAHPARAAHRNPRRARRWRRRRPQMCLNSSRCQWRPRSCSSR
jgi:hypothetical protein